MRYIFHCKILTILIYLSNLNSLFFITLIIVAISDFDAFGNVVVLASVGKLKEGFIPWSPQGYE